MADTDLYGFPLQGSAGNALRRAVPGGGIMRNKTKPSPEADEDG